MEKQILRISEVLKDVNDKKEEKIINNEDLKICNEKIESLSKSESNINRILDDIENIPEDDNSSLTRKLIELHNEMTNVKNNYDDLHNLVKVAIQGAGCTKCD